MFTKIRHRIILFAAVLLFLMTVHLIIYFFIPKPNMKIKSVGNGYFIKTKGCRIPSFDPFGPAVEKFIEKMKPLQCSDKPPLIISDIDTLYLQQHLLPHYNVMNLSNFICCYEEFQRDDPKFDEVDNFYTTSKECIILNITTKIDKEFVQVICISNGVEFYKDYFSFVPVKRKSFAINKPSVLVIGMDSVSRQNLYRQMPKTVSYLTEKLNAIEMFGLNKVGDHTFPNVIPILTGQTQQELSDSCWSWSIVSLRRPKFDNCPFIWKNYKKAGFLTSFAEDSSWMGLFNHEEKRGFNVQPTDYYWRTYNYIAETEIGHAFNSSPAQLCVGANPIYKVLLDYSKKLTLSLKNESYFAWFWESSLTHDFLNSPALADEDYELFFKHLHNSNSLENTIVIFLSDHGFRHGDILLTHQGRLEERLPFLFFLFPKWIHELHPTAINNLKTNSRRLISHFDLHETLLDLIDVNKLTIINIGKRSQTEAIYKRGISLFLEIPENRTCISAGIGPHWCTCNKSVKIEKIDDTIEKLAAFIVNYINRLLKVNTNNCSELYLDSIVGARLLISDEYYRKISFLKGNSKINDYIVTLRTRPGNAIFESTVRCVNCEETDSMEIQGTISRLNQYGNQSSCVSDLDLKLYCYCI